MPLRKARYARKWEGKNRREYRYLRLRRPGKVIAAAVDSLLLVPARLIRHGSCYRWGKSGQRASMAASARFGVEGCREEGTFFFLFIFALASVPSRAAQIWHMT